MIKAVFFDIDGTLYSYDDAHGKAFSKLCRFAQEQVGIPAEDFAADWAREVKLHKEEIGNQAAIHNRLIRSLRILEKRGKPLHFAAQLEKIYWESLIEAAEPEPGLRACIHTLREKGYLLCIASNMTLDWQLKKLEKLAILEDFRYIITSEEAGVEKPRKEFFDACIRYAQVRPEECLMVGDSLRSDVLGAEAAGMKALWYAEDAKLSEHPGFSHFSQLEAAITALDKESDNLKNR